MNPSKRAASNITFLVEGRLNGDLNVQPDVVSDLSEIAVALDHVHDVTGLPQVHLDPVSKIIALVVQD